MGWRLKAHPRYALGIASYFHHYPLNPGLTSRHVGDRRVGVISCFAHKYVEYVLALPKHNRIDTLRGVSTIKLVLVMLIALRI